MRDVGNGDADDVAAGIAGSGSGDRMDRIVVILGVGRIDGDEGHFAPILAAVASVACRARLRFGNSARAEKRAGCHGHGSRSG